MWYVIGLIALIAIIYIIWRNQEKKNEEIKDYSGGPVGREIKRSDVNLGAAYRQRISIDPSMIADPALDLLNPTNLILLDTILNHQNVDSDGVPLDPDGFPDTDGIPDNDGQPDDYSSPSESYSDNSSSYDSGGGGYDGGGGGDCGGGGGGD